MIHDITPKPGAEAQCRTRCTLDTETTTPTTPICTRRMIITAAAAALPTTRSILSRTNSRRREDVTVNAPPASARISLLPVVRHTLARRSHHLYILSAYSRARPARRRLHDLPRHVGPRAAPPAARRLRRGEQRRVDGRRIAGGVVPAAAQPIPLGLRARDLWRLDPGRLPLRPLRRIRLFDARRLPHLCRRLRFGRDGRHVRCRDRRPRRPPAELRRVRHPL